MAEDGRSRLGRGLAALIGDVGEETKTVERARSARKAPIELIKPNPRNPRRVFSDTELDELAASIKERGIIQPIVVRAAKGGAESYEIIAGERRWRAAQRAGMHEVPIVPLDVTDDEALQLAIVENVQRTDLNPIEEATGYERLMSEFNHTQDDIAQMVGKSRVHVSNTMRLLKLSEPVKALIHSGKLTAGHARALVGQPNAEELAEIIIKRGLNVRQVEAWARNDGKAQVRGLKGKKKRGGKDADTVALERRVSDALGLNVSIDHKASGGGTLHIEYGDLDQLEDVLKKLERGG
jgi:ParB family chromosome partitioning protein